MSFGKISKMSRQAHDPWGNKRGNRRGHICGYQYLVNQGEILDEPGTAKTNNYIWYLDKPKAYEVNYDRFVKSGKRSIERLRR